MSKKEIVLLDGGMGQELVKRGVAKSNPIWGAQVMIDSPQLVCDLHKEYIAAGARVITLNAYSLTPERLATADVEDQFAKLQATAIDLAKRARDEAGQSDVKIAGCLPPLVASYHPAMMMQFDDAVATYRKVVEAQHDHVDLFICETMSSSAEALASTTAAAESGVPVWTALSVDDNCNGLLRSGEQVKDAWDAIESLGPAALLINCSIPEAVNAAWPKLQDLPCKAGAYANGFTSVMNMKPGGGVAMLEARGDLGPAAYAEYAMGWAEQGADIVGGCCEISPQHIGKLANDLMAEGYEIVGKP